jgi:serine/threonine-protein kinase
VLNRLRGEGGLPLAMHLRVLADVLAGLHHAHELCDFDGTPLNVVHRDVTPQNVFVTYEGAVKVVDFGIAKATCSMVETRAGLFKGKVAYIAPEQARGEHVDRRADIFTTGVMLWEAIAGRRPWTGMDEVTILKRLVNDDFPSVREARPGAPEQLVAILGRALAHGREQRYATAAEFQADLEAYLEATGEHTHNRHLGQLVERYFAADRARIRALVEEEVRVSRAEAEAERSSSRESVKLVPLPSERTTLPETAPRTPPGEAARAQPGSLSAVARLSPPPSPPARRLPVLAAVGLLAGAALVLVALRLGSGPTPEVRAEPVVSAPVVPVPPAGAAAEVELQIDASPAGATIFVDGVAARANPLTTRLRRDRAEHEIRVEAPGFTRSVERLVFDRDRALRIVLAPAPSPPAAIPTASPSRPSRGEPAARPRGTQRSVDERNPYPTAPQRSVDERNPYGRP